MFAFTFMRHAFVASTFIALTCGVIGVFVVARQLSFLAHMLSEIGFAGAAFGAFLGISPLIGMLLFTLASSLLISSLSVERVQRESTISAVSSLFIGSGILFLALANQSSSYATDILFGSIVGISQSGVWQLVVLSLVVLLTIWLIFRPLQFDSFDSVGAKANGVHSRVIGIIFLILLAMSVSVGAQIVGSMLVFILLTLPASIAKALGHSMKQLLLISVAAALFGVWLGLWLGYLTNWPVTFFIALIEVICYMLALLVQKRRNG
ncbi:MULTISPECIES: metal ABC transporter permease [Lapidilactobacillus]|uniref:Metal ABC transporter permease n=1 Tax=Lapidilactobacillus achengensis TaxID=2486000 RepID=A0ABW1UMJ3_9LACO|nr:MULTISPECIES: metal ABC transporter permease [Lapidilactobacillus]